MCKGRGACSDVDSDAPRSSVAAAKTKLDFDQLRGLR
jgi:hypothetical protein